MKTQHKFSKKKKRFKPREWIWGWDRIEYALIRIGVFFINLFPLKTTTWIARRAGDVMFVLFRKRAQIAFENISIAYGDTKTQDEKHRIARECFRNTACSLLELFRTSQFLHQADRHFSFQGTEHLDRAFEKGKGVILVISHLGSWEYLAFLPYLRHYPCSVIGRPMSNPYIYKWVQSLRNSTTLVHIDKKNASKKILKELKENHLVAILIDQWGGPEGIPTHFFGSLTSTTSIPARLARHTGAALIPAYCLRMPDEKYAIVIEPEIPLSTSENWEKETTDALNRQLENKISLFPEQWAWGHRRWKELPQELLKKRF